MLKEQKEKKFKIRWNKGIIDNKIELIFNKKKRRKSNKWNKEVERAQNREIWRNKLIKEKEMRKMAERREKEKNVK